MTKEKIINVTRKLKLVYDVYDDLVHKYLEEFLSELVLFKRTLNWDFLNEYRRNDDLINFSYSGNYSQYQLYDNHIDVESSNYSWHTIPIVYITDKEEFEKWKNDVLQQESEWKDKNRDKILKKLKENVEKELLKHKEREKRIIELTEEFQEFQKERY